MSAHAFKAAVHYGTCPECSEWARIDPADTIDGRPVCQSCFDVTIELLSVRERLKDFSPRPSKRGKPDILSRIDPRYAPRILNNRMKSAVHKSLRGRERASSWFATVGYTPEELRAHLEAQFVDGMSWTNIGDWHVDHIRPLASFEITGAHCPQFKAAWALSNLQPLWALDNMRKGAKWRPNE